MRKLLPFLLCFSLLFTACHKQQSPRDEVRSDLTYRQRLARDQNRREHPEDYAEDDQFSSEIVEAGFYVCVLPFIYISDQIKERIKLARGDTPAKAAHEMNDPNVSPDTHRQGIADLVTQWTFTRRPPYTTRYKQIAERDPNPTVRAMAIRALNISRDSSATPLFISALEDDNELVRLEAVKALSNVPDPNAVPALLRRLEGRRDASMGSPAPAEESRDVRIAAADALRHYHTLEVARSLVTQLDEREFAVAWQSHHSLVILIGENFGYDEAAWLRYITGPQKPFG